MIKGDRPGWVLSMECHSVGGMIPEPTGQAAGPCDAAFLPRLQMAFRAAREPITEPVSKFGG